MTSSRHSAPNWLRTPIWLRTSSDRFVSCVVPHVMVTGQRSAVADAHVWKWSGEMPQTAGEPPTSLSETICVQR